MRERNGLRAAVDSELADHALDVRRDRLGADEEAARDAFLRDPGREQAQNLTLTPRQVIPHARRPARGPGREPPAPGTERAFRTTMSGRTWARQTASRRLETIRATLVEVDEGRQIYPPGTAEVEM